MTTTARRFEAAQGNRSSWGYSTKIIWNEETGSYVVTEYGHLYQVERTSGTASVLSTDMERVTRDGAGNYIAVDDTNAFHVAIG